jgi:hypothetical protein
MIIKPENFKLLDAFNKMSVVNRTKLIDFLSCIDDVHIEDMGYNQEDVYVIDNLIGELNDNIRNA